MTEPPAGREAGGSPLLRLDGLDVVYPGRRGRGAWALRQVDLAIGAGERVAIVGESGCGKTTLLRALLGVLPARARVGGAAVLAPPPGEQGRNAGAVDLAGASERRLRLVRGRLVGYVPQNPLAAFDPLRSVGHHLREAWAAHGRSVTDGELVAELEAVGILEPGPALRQRPATWSGGMLQRAAIVAATAHEPPLVLADEPTSALDRPLARSMLDLLRRRSLSLVVVTHDLDLVPGLVDRVVVMYAGRIVEDRPAADLLHDPTHPYTVALLRSLPRPGRLPDDLPGDPPPLTEPDEGCAFAPRCSRAEPDCRAGVPVLAGGVACLLAHRPGAEVPGGPRDDVDPAPEAVAP